MYILGGAAACLPVGTPPLPETIYKMADAIYKSSDAIRGYFQKNCHYLLQVVFLLTAIPMSTPWSAFAPCDFTPEEQLGYWKP